MCGKLFSNPMLHLGPQKQWSRKIPKNSGSTPTPCLDKAVLAQGGASRSQSALHMHVLVCICSNVRQFHEIIGMIQGEGNHIKEQ